MKRNIQNMDSAIFNRVSEQIDCHKKAEFSEWVRFVENELAIYREEQHENAFYFFISSQSVTLHGFGEPLLDPRLRERIEVLSEKNVPTYFSCNPSNINLKKIEALFQAGLKYIKFSVDSLSDERMKEIRGQNANGNKAQRKILQVLDMKEKRDYPVTIVVCMIKLSRKQDKEAEEFLRFWEDQDVFPYIKSQDNQWYFRDQESDNAKSHYVYQYCDFPWTSLSVMVDGTVVPCTQDFNCEMSFGNVRDKPLKEIWNSDEYKKFRRMHIAGEFPRGYRCKDRCDLRLVADYLR